MKNWNALNFPLKKGALDRDIAALVESDYTLKVVVIHDDEGTRALASEVLERTATSVGADSFRCAFWSMGDVLDFGILEHAVQAAVAADVIIVAVRESVEAPPGLCAWIDVWLPRRSKDCGALLALLGVPEELPIGSGPTRDYLRAVAKRANLDFLAGDQMLPGTYPSAVGETPAVPRTGEF